MEKGGRREERRRKGGRRQEEEVGGRNGGKRKKHKFVEKKPHKKHNSREKPFKSKVYDDGRTDNARLQLIPSELNSLDKVRMRIILTPAGSAQKARRISDYDFLFLGLKLCDITAIHQSRLDKISS